MISMNFTTHLHSVHASFKCKYKRVCAKITEIIQFIFCSSFMHMYFILIRTMEELHKTNSTVFYFTS